MEITVARDGVTFDITAEDGTTACRTVALTILSDDIGFELDSIFGMPIDDDKVYLSEKDYKALGLFSDVLSNTDYSVAEGATVTADYDDAKHEFSYTVTSEDGSTCETYHIGICVEEPFGTHSIELNGDPSAFYYDYDRGVYAVSADELTTEAATIVEKDKNLSTYYAFTVDVGFDKLVDRGEFLLQACEATNVNVRFAVRYSSNDDMLNVFSDYRNRGAYLNYTVHKSIKASDITTVRLGVIQMGNSTVMRLNDETIFRRTLPSSTRPELVVASYSLCAYFNIVDMVTDRYEVENMYYRALYVYQDINYGGSISGSGANAGTPVQTEKGVRINSLTASTRIVTQVYYEGVPVYGPEWAVYGKADVSTVGATRGNSMVELQVGSRSNALNRFNIGRVSANNGVYSQVGIAGAVTKKLIELSTASEMTFEYVMFYQNGLIELWWKDSDTNLEWTRVYTVKYNWNNAGFLVGMIRLVDVVYYDFKAYYNNDFDELVEQFGALSEGVDYMDSVAPEDNGTFERKGNTFYKTDDEYSYANLYNGEESVKGNYWYVSGHMALQTYGMWTQAEIAARSDDGYAVRYVLEYVGGGQFQIFSETKEGTAASWRDWNLVLSPSANNLNFINFALVNENGTYYFIVNGTIRHMYEGLSDNYTLTHATIGGKGGVVKMGNLFVETDEANVRSFTEGIEWYSYVSPYENRMASLEKQYKDATKGGILLFGSSSIDFWDNWAQDLDLEDGVSGYNVGIGGTIVEDWLYAYDRLVKPFAPSKVVIFLGGNNISSGYSAAQTAQKLKELLEKLHNDVPDADIIYVISTYAPSGYRNDAFVDPEYGKFVKTITSFCEETDWITGVDLYDAIIVDGNQKPGYFRSDDIHLTELGYNEAWVPAVRKALGMDRSEV